MHSISFHHGEAARCHAAMLHGMHSFHGIITSRNTIQIKNLVCFGEHCIIAFGDLSHLKLMV